MRMNASGSFLTGNGVKVPDAAGITFDDRTDVEMVRGCRAVGMATTNLFSSVFQFRSAP